MQRPQIDNGRLVSDKRLKKYQASPEPAAVINMRCTTGAGSPKGVTPAHTDSTGDAKSVEACTHFTTADNLCAPVPFYSSLRTRARRPCVCGFRSRHAAVDPVQTRYCS